MCGSHDAVSERETSPRVWARSRPSDGPNGARVEEGNGVGAEQATLSGHVREGGGKEGTWAELPSRPWAEMGCG